MNDISCAENRSCHFQIVFLMINCIVLFWGVPQVSAQIQELEPLPAWSSGNSYQTRSLAWADLDGDGDLDLACGNYDNSNTFYENVDGALSSSSIWSPAEENRTFCMAWGDVDGDGDLDLACGNNGANTLYENVGDSLDPVAIWSSEPTNNTRSVVWADVDNDGDLDLACGNFGENTIYLNIGGSLELDPGWSSGEDNTYDLAWADIDDDGDLDLACGNVEDSNTLYLNYYDEYGVLYLGLDWSSGQANDTRTVAWADIDGDGDFDLVCGNSDSNTLYENDAGTLSTNPDWSSAPTNNTMSIALADVDRDGDLDLACGNFESSNTVYENIDGILSSDPAWSSELENRTYCVTWADIDGDGALDLASGNFGANFLYQNIGSCFSTTPDWSSDPINLTNSVALADMDGDGDLDLACGNNGIDPNTIYENVDGSLSVDPTWLSDSPNDTNELVWADVDGNGYPDLVCGNESSSVTLYKNFDGLLDTTPSESIATVSRARSVDLGDVDGDGDLDLASGGFGVNTLHENIDGSFSTGQVLWLEDPWSTGSISLADIDGDRDLDLVCGQYGTENKNTIHENVGGSLSVSHTWISTDENSSRGIALKDVDGDGDLDLVCGNHENSNTINENVDGTLTADTSWSSALEYSTQCVDLADVDCDGDLDLACGNFGVDTLYENIAGSLSMMPIWSSGEENTTTDLALADVDRDGDIDLVCGIYNGRNIIYSNSIAPVFKGSTTSAANHLPNNGTYLRNVTVSILPPETDNLRRISFEAFDVEADVFYIVPRYQFEGEPSWRPVELEDGTLRAGPFTASPDGAAGSFVWDTARFPRDARNIVLKLLVDEVPRRVSVIQHVAPYLKRLAPVEPRRPVSAVDVSTLQFGITTVGDTTSVNITLENRGNEILTVAGIDLPSSEMTLTPTPPFDVATGASVELVVSLLPETQLDVTGEIQINSNDPAVPVLSLAVEAEVLPLDFSTELLRVQEVIPLGEAATVVVQAAANVRLERGTLFYRAVGEADFLPLPLVQSDAGFSVVIAGTDITERGLEYYIEMENSGIFATDPPGAPADSLFFQAVASPSAIATAPVPNAGAEFQQGQTIAVNTSVPQGSGYLGGSLNFRRSGEAEYQEVTLEGEPPLLIASIPSDQAGISGLEYYVAVQTLTGELTDPPTNPETAPHTISISVVELEETDSSAGLTYRMVSLPLDFGEGIHRDWQDLLSVSPEFGLYDPVRWRSYRYDPVESAYTELAPDTDDELFRLVPGKGFWLICHEDHRIGIGAASGYSTPTDSSYTITLASGWNQMGNPFAFPVAWDSVLVEGLSPAATDTLFDGPVAWVPGVGYVETVAVLEPFDGYFINNLSPADITLQIPARSAPPVAFKVSPPPEPYWVVSIDARTVLVADTHNTIGVHPAAEPWFDRFDRSEPPPSPGRAISLYFPHGEWRQHAGIYTTDFRPVMDAEQTDESWGHGFRFDVAKNYTADGADEVTLSFAGMADVPSATAISLVDHHLGRTFDLRDDARYSFHLGKHARVVNGSDARFTLLIGSEEFVAEGQPLPPLQTALHQNYPNPFNPSTAIRFDVAEACQVRLQIFDLSGALVRTLHNGLAEPGGYEVPWFGRSDQGSRLASGVYFYRLEAGRYLETRRMTLIK